MSIACCFYESDSRDSLSGYGGHIKNQWKIGKIQEVRYEKIINLYECQGHTEKKLSALY